MIPNIGQKFNVTFKNDKRSFDGVIVRVNKNDADREFVIRQTNRVEYDVRNQSYSLPDSEIEVERNWFDYELTGRKVTITDQIQMFV